MNEVEYLSKELWKSRRVLSVETEADNTLGDLHNSSCVTKAEFNIHSK